MKALAGRFLTPALILAAGAGAFWASSRLAPFSLDAITFYFACASVVSAAGLGFVALKKGGAVFEAKSPDFLYFGIVLASIASYLIISRRFPPLHQVVALGGSFIIFLLFRVACSGTLRNCREILAWALVGAASMEAVWGLFQAARSAQMRGHFFNRNHLAMYLSLHIPLGIALLMGSSGRPLRRALAAGSSAVLVAGVVLAGCRTAWIGAGVAVSFLAYSRFGKGLVGRWMKKRKYLLAPAALACAAGIWFSAGVLYGLRPTSVDGRLLVWKVSWRMLSASPVWGVGFGNFSRSYNYFQAEYFRSGAGSAFEQAQADDTLYAFNEYLETALELGLPGGFLFIVFWVVVLRAALAALLRPRGSPDGRPDLVRAGFAGLVLVFMILGLFYYPGRILPLLLIFSVGLASLLGERRESPGRPFVSLSRKTLAATAALLLLVGCAVLPSLASRFAAERRWMTAPARAGSESGPDLSALYSDLHRPLGKHGGFLRAYGRFLLDAGRVDEAVRVFEQARSIRPDPFLVEDLASAFRASGRPAEALEQARLACDILPWRLTSKALAADLALSLGRPQEARRLARAILDAPVRVPTSTAERIKEEAKTILRTAAEAPPKPGGEPRQNSFFLPFPERLSIARALREAGGNAGELARALNSVQGEKREALAFLIANMPSRDLRSLKAGYLLTNLEYAFKVRGALPYTRAIPEDVFRNFVLPYAQLAEDRESWRKDFYERFFRVAREASSSAEAVVTLNRSIFDEILKTGFKAKDYRLSVGSPLATARKGRGSCAELSVILADACRAVGIPARIVFIPRWPGYNIGHVWMEVYDQGGWVQCGGFDRESYWISARAAMVDPSKPEYHIFAACWEKTGLHAVFGRDVSFLDVTENYLTWSHYEGRSLLIIRYSELVPRIFPAVSDFFALIASVLGRG